MPSTHRLTANFTNRIGQEIALPPGSQSMLFLGSGGDANNGNRVSGGPAPILSAGAAAPVVSSNFVTVGYDGTNSRYIDLNIQRSAALLAAGWTWASVARTEASGASAGTVMSDSGGAGGAVPTASTLCGFSFQVGASHNSYLHSSGTGIRATLTMPGFVAAWHFLAVTYTGGAAGTHSLSEYTDNIGGTTPVTYVASGLASGTNSPSLGGVVPNWTASYTVPIDVAWAFAAQGAMTQANIAALAASVRPWLARRGIVM